MRTLLLSLAATALLAGCVTTSPYGYRGEGRGDYYYGAPSVEYRYHGGAGYYGGPYYGPYRPGWSIYGGYGGYGYPYYGYPYYGGSPYYRPIYRPIYRPGPSSGYQPRPEHRPDGGPWRNIDEVRRRRVGDATPGAPGVVPPTPSMPSAAPRPRMDRGGSAIGEIIRRSREARPGSSDPTP